MPEWASERASERAREDDFRDESRDRAAETEIAELERENADLMNAGLLLRFIIGVTPVDAPRDVDRARQDAAMRSAVVEPAVSLVGRRAVSCFQGTVGILVRSRRHWCYVASRATRVTELWLRKQPDSLDFVPDCDTTSWKERKKGGRGRAGEGEGEGE